MKTTFNACVAMIITFSFAFAAYGVSPTVTTKAASSIDSFSVTLNGTVNPNGSNVVAYFSWGTTPSYSGNYVPSPPWTESGNSTINLSYTMTNLSANTKYYYQTVSYVFGNSGNISYGGSSNFTTLYPPILNVSPSSGLTSTGYLGGPFIPPNEPYSVANINIGSGTLKWTASADQNWVTVSPTNGQTTVGNPATVTVSFNGNANSLAIGSHSSTVTFGGNGGSTTRQVQLTVSSPPPALSVSPVTGLTSSGPQGGSFSPASKQYTISNTGGGTLYWSANANSNWVTVLPGSGQNSGTVTVSINNNANSLSAQGYSWTYQSLVTFSANVGNSVTNIILPVNLTVTTSPQLSVSPSGNLTTSGDHGGPFSPASQQYSLSNVGIGTLNWTAGADANWVTVSSSNGQNSGNVTVSINSNANSLSAGTYSSTVTFGGNGGSITRQVQLTVTNAPVSASLSSLAAAPSTAPADGSSQITATVTVRDIYGNPVSGKTVQFYASEVNNSGIPVVGSLQFQGSVNPTDANGHTTAALTANTPGTVTITAKDTTDNVAVQQPVTVTFTNTGATPVSIPLALSNEVVTLYQDSANFLDGTVEGFNPSVTSVPISVVPIYWLAPSEGHIGDYFQNQATSAKAQAVMDAAFFDGGQLLDPLGEEAPTILKLISAEGQNALNTEADFGIQGYFDWIANSSSGCSTEAQGIVNGGISDQQALQSQQSSLLTGIPQSSANLAAAWTTNLQSQLNANHVLMGMAAQQVSYLLIVSNAWQVSHNPVSSLEQGGLEAIAIGAAQFVPVVDVGVDLLLIGYSEYQNYQSFTGAQNNYALAQRSLLSCFGYTDEIYSNTAAGFSEIANGSAPNTVTSQILGGYTMQVGYQSQMPYSWLSLNGPTYATVITNVYSMVNVQNMGTNAANFEVVALYSYSNNIFSALPSTSIAQLSNVGAGQSSWVQLEYFDGNIGALPNTADPIQIYLLGINNTGIFYGGSTNFIPSTFQLTSYVNAEGSIKISGQSKNPVPLDGGSDATSNAVVIESPIRCQIVQNASNQTYQATIQISDPFILPLTAIVTQPILSGMDVLATDGTNEISSIVWTNTIYPTNIIANTFIFSLAVTPGAQTNLPPPTVVFSDNTGTNSASFQSVAPAFMGLFPVQASGSIPVAAWGVNSSMLVALTNLTSTGQTGLYTIALSDSSGNAVTNLSEAFSLNGLGGTNLYFILPVSLLAGSYTLTGSLSINGGTGQVLAGNYVVPPQPITLAVDSPPIDSNGFFHLKFNGPPGSNYVVMATSNLSSPTNWQAIAFYSPTNTPASIAVPMPTNTSQMFYELMMMH